MDIIWCTIYCLLSNICILFQRSLLVLLTMNACMYSIREEEYTVVTTLSQGSTQPCHKVLTGRLQFQLLSCDNHATTLFTTMYNLVVSVWVVV